MSKFSREYLFRECVLHRHCILLRLCRGIKWDNVEVDEIFMIDLYIEENEQEKILLNISQSINTYGKIVIKAFAGQNNPHNARITTISTDEIIDIELITN